MWNNRHFIFKVAHCNVFGIRYTYFSHVLNCISPALPTPIIRILPIFDAICRMSLGIQCQSIGNLLHCYEYR